MKVRTMQGIDLDITALMAQHDQSIAIGNARMNARGDIIGRGGKIIKKREQIVQEYYQKNPKAVKKISLRDIKPDVMKPAEAITVARQQAKNVEQHKKRKINDSE